MPESSDRTTPHSTGSSPKGLMRSLGEFFGHIVKAVRTEPTRSGGRTTVEVSRKSDLRETDNIILRRTTIEEIEVKEDRG